MNKKELVKKVEKELKKQKTRYNPIQWEIEANKTTALKNIKEGREFDKHKASLNAFNADTPSNYEYPIENTDASLPTGLYVKNRKDYTELVGREGEADDAAFYAHLVKTDPKAAKFYLEMHVDSYSNQPLTQWGRDRRAVRTKDISNTGIKISEFVTNEDGVSRHILDTDKVMGCGSFQEKPKGSVYNQNYTEADYRPKQQTVEEEMISMITVAELVSLVQKK